MRAFDPRSIRPFPRNAPSKINYPFVKYDESTSPASADDSFTNSKNITMSFIHSLSALPDAALNVSLLFSASLLPLAQIPSALKTSFQYGLGVLSLIGFLWGVVKIWGGADQMSKGNADGKTGIIAGIIIAGAGAIMGALFTIFGMGDGVIAPLFT